MPTISVVICAHNEEDWIKRALNALAQQYHPADEIIVVDNASTDRTAEIVNTFAQNHPQANVRSVYEARKGLYIARETGWRAASSDIVAMTDADITFPPDWVQIIHEEFSSSDVDAITGSIRYDDAPAFINWVTWLSDQLYQPEGIGRLMTSEYVLNGGNSAYRRTALEAVNGYVDKPADEFEDRYMSQQMHAHNFTIKFVRRLKVWHTFRRFAKDGWRGYLNYIFYYDVDGLYADHIEADKDTQKKVDAS